MVKGKKAKKATGKTMGFVILPENLKILQKVKADSHYSLGRLINGAISFASENGGFTGLPTFETAAVRRAKETLARWESGQVTIRKAPQRKAASTKRVNVG